MYENGIGTRVAEPAAAAGVLWWDYFRSQQLRVSSFSRTIL